MQADGCTAAVDGALQRNELHGSRARSRAEVAMARLVVKSTPPLMLYDRQGFIGDQRLQCCQCRPQKHVKQ